MLGLKTISVADIVASGTFNKKVEKLKEKISSFLLYYLVLCSVIRKLKFIYTSL